VKAVKVPSRLMRRLTYANIVATLALIIAIGGGSAYAASHLITGKQIAKGTITAANIKKSTFTSNLFKKGTLKTGPAGPAGAPGAPGAPGAAGAPGSALAYGLIENNSVGNPAFISGATKGFTTVYSPATGELCIAVPAGATGVPLQVTDASNEPHLWDQVSPAQCGGAGYELADETGQALVGALVVSVP
jgi:hypothetical protein